MEQTKGREMTDIGDLEEAFNLALVRKQQLEWAKDELRKWREALDEGDYVVVPFKGVYEIPLKGEEEDYGQD